VEVLVEAVEKEVDKSEADTHPWELLSRLMMTMKCSISNLLDFLSGIDLSARRVLGLIRAIALPSITNPLDFEDLLKYRYHLLSVARAVDFSSHTRYTCDRLNFLLIQILGRLICRDPYFLLLVQPSSFLHVV
jgi:hypothetical protein